MAVQATKLNQHECLFQSLTISVFVFFLIISQLTSFSSASPEHISDYSLCCPNLESSCLALELQ